MCTLLLSVCLLLEDLPFYYLVLVHKPAITVLALFLSYHQCRRKENCLLLDIAQPEDFV